MHLFGRTTGPGLLLSSSRLLHIQKVAGEDRDIPEFTTLDRLFHMSLFQAAGVPSLWHLIAGRSGHIDRLRRLNLPDPGKIAQVLDTHERISAAITEGDARRAEACMREYLSGPLASLAAIMAGHPQYFEDKDQ